MYNAVVAMLREVEPYIPPEGKAPRTQQEVKASEVYRCLVEVAQTLTGENLKEIYREEEKPEDPAAPTAAAA